MTEASDTSTATGYLATQRRKTSTATWFYSDQCFNLLSHYQWIRSRLLSIHIDDQSFINILVDPYAYTQFSHILFAESVVSICL